MAASRDETANLVQTNVPGEKPPTEVVPAKNVQPAKVIGQEDLDQLEKANPFDAFDFLAQDFLLSRSTEKSSHVSADDVSETSKENLLAELWSKVLEANLFEAIKQDENIIAKVKELLCRLGTFLSGSKIKEFSRVL